MEQVTSADMSLWEALTLDEEIVADLRAVGINVHEPEAPASLDQARPDAIASMLLRREAESLEAIDDLERSRSAEVQFITSRYALQIERHRARAANLEAAVRALAQQTKDAGGYVGKKKSRDVGAGTYGYRTNAPCVELRDEAAYIAWAEANAPETLRVKLTLTLATAKEFLSETELATTRREVVKAAAAALADAAPELPAGFTRVDESHDFYAKPLPAAAITGATV